MKILVLAWEFPPRIVGGISRHVAELYPELVQMGHEIHLLTVEFGLAPHYEVVEGIHVHRVPVGGSNDFFHWVGKMNDSMGQHGGKLLQEEAPFDIIHAHDWLVADAAIALKHLFNVPLIATIHATEFGRCNGLHSDTSHYINGKETELVREAWRVIVCTNYMRLEVERVLHCHWDNIDVVYNGIRRDRPPLLNFDPASFRRFFAADQEKIVYYVGRMSYEKGVELFLNAAPKVIWEMASRVKFVIIGGGNTDHLKRQAWNLGIWHKCYFTGFMSDADLARFRAIANCSVFPSLYEPFGIVALESFAAHVPAVVSDTGNADSIALGILEVLKNPERSKELTANAYQDLEARFNWTKLAQQTEAVYGRVLHEQGHVHVAD
jgi:glycosyltransferase involved in cell wall biosynthesis